MQRPLPKTIWIALASLASAAVLCTWLAASRGSWAMLTIAGFALVLGVGLYHGRRWALGLTLVYVVISTLVTYSQQQGWALTIFLLDALVVLPVLLSAGYFLPRRRATADVD